MSTPTPPRRRRMDTPPNPGAPPAELAAFDAGHSIAVRQCIAIVLRHFANDYSGVACLEELRRLGEP